MVLAVHRHHLCCQGLYARTLLANENMMGTFDVCNQVGQRPVLPVLTVRQRTGHHALLQAFQGLVDGNLCFSAGFAEGAAPATTVIDSQLLEFACSVRHFGGDFAHGVGACDWHLASPSALPATLLWASHDNHRLATPPRRDYDFCHADDRNVVYGWIGPTVGRELIDPLRLWSLRTKSPAVGPHYPLELSNSACNLPMDGITTLRPSVWIKPSDWRRLRLRDTNSRTVPICAANSLLLTGSVIVIKSPSRSPSALPSRTSRAIKRCRTVVNESSSMIPTRRSRCAPTTRRTLRATCGCCKQRA